MLLSLLSFCSCFYSFVGLVGCFFPNSNSWDLENDGLVRLVSSTLISVISLTRQEKAADTMAEILTAL